MPYLSPPTLTRSEVESLLAVTCRNPRDHLIISIALGTGLRLGEIVGLDVGDVFLPDGSPRTRIRLRAEIAKGGRVGDVFLPDALLAEPRTVRAVAVRSVVPPTREADARGGPRRLALMAPPGENEAEIRGCSAVGGQS